MSRFATAPDLPATRAQTAMGLLYFPLAFCTLYFDGVDFTATHTDARLWVNLGSMLYFGILFWVAGYRLRWLMAVMVPLFYIGEELFCHGFDWYQYRTYEIPMYVPFGHAIVYGSGYMLAHMPVFLQHDVLVRKLMIGFFLLVFLAAGIFFNDIFTLISGVIFGLLMIRKRWQNLYFFVGICVMAVELIGTHWGCWRWHQVFGIFPTANPPMGALAYYIAGDIVLARIVKAILKKRNPAYAV